MTEYRQDLRLFPKRFGLDLNTCLQQGHFDPLCFMKIQHIEHLLYPESYTDERPPLFTGRDTQYPIHRHDKSSLQLVRIDSY